jgi:hypothetical protein
VAGKYYTKYGYFSQEEFLNTLKDIGPEWNKALSGITDPKDVAALHNYVKLAEKGQAPKMYSPEEWDTLTPEQKAAFDADVEEYMLAVGKPKYNGKTWEEMTPTEQGALVAAFSNPKTHGPTMKEFFRESLTPEEYDYHFTVKDPKLPISPLAQERGYTTPVFHGTGKRDHNTPDFQEFDWKRGDGFHMGTVRAAHDILGGGRSAGSRIIPLLAKIQNPLHLPTDMGRWSDPSRWRQKLANTEEWGLKAPAGVPIYTKTGQFGSTEKFWPSEAARSLPEEHWRKLMDLSFTAGVHTSRDFLPALKDTLQSLGYDGISYVNNVEDPGSISYMLFDSAQVKVPWARSFDHTSPLINEASGFPVITLEESDEPEWEPLEVTVYTPRGPLQAVPVDEEPEW